MHFLCAFFISVLISRDKTVINCINERDGLSYLLTSKPLLRLQSGLCNQLGDLFKGNSAYFSVVLSTLCGLEDWNCGIEILNVWSDIFQCLFF